MVVRSNIDMAITPPRIARLRLNLVQSLTGAQRCTTNVQADGRTDGQTEFSSLDRVNISRGAVKTTSSAMTSQLRYSIL